ncbi:MAG: MATE family efflux transporter [Muribaculum sp.]|nr:MATE family efflux transporter [Muribaculaceae bacterium]MCM1080540.1 MATE family efflux transporter [Muribaculum sp.]
MSAQASGRGLEPHSKSISKLDIKLIQTGAPLNFSQRLKLAAQLSWPAMMAQLSSILMQYIDAAMVGRLGADESAAVGLVSTSLWLFWGVCSAATVGFSVQVAHKVGAADYKNARNILGQSICACLLFGVFMAALGVGISWQLPVWLGGTDAVCHNATLYFMIFVGALPLLTMNYLGSGMLRAVGNMKVPGALNVMMCLLDVAFNFLLIFPTHHFDVAGFQLTVPGAGLGVIGAALGTVCAEIITATLIMWYLLCRQKDIEFRRHKVSLRPQKHIIKNALRISAPLTLEHAIICGAQIMVTVIVAPLGVMAIAANAFAVTAESLCYMPGYGIADAATTLVGQSYGASRPKLARQFGFMTVGMGMVLMGIMGIVLYIAAPAVMSLMTPVGEICSLGVEALRIEAWAEPMFAASIVAYGVMVGVGDTVVPAIMNFGSIWLVRIPIAALLAPTWGLAGVWTAMCIELCFRGLIFLIRLIRGSWLKHGLKIANEP